MQKTDLTVGFGASIAMDVDGVIVDIYDALEKAVYKKFSLWQGTFSKDEIYSWSMLELCGRSYGSENGLVAGVNIRKYILELFKNSEFMYNLPVYNDVKDNFYGFLQLCKQKSCSLTFETGVADCVKSARGRFLYEFMQFYNFSANVNIQTSKEQGVYKNVINYDVLIDDCLDVVNKSNALIKLVPLRCHNRLEAFRLGLENPYCAYTNFKTVISVLKERLK